MSGAQPSKIKLEDVGLLALVRIARYHGISTALDQIRHVAGISQAMFSATDLALSAKRLGLKTKLATFNRNRLSSLPCPALVLDSCGKHFVLVACSGDSAHIWEPGSHSPLMQTLDDIERRVSGVVILFASRASVAGDLARFDFSWFVPAVVKYRHSLFEVVLASVIFQLLGLVSPLMFQVVMDKVLTNRAYSTLNVVCLVLLVAYLLESALSGLRNYILSHTTNRIDVELGARLFRHLLALPLGYFVARRVGDSVARVRELESVRNFLTGQALTAALDLLFSVLFISVMLVYSVPLTLIVIASLPLYAGISAFLNPMLRQRLNEKFSRGADNNSFLVETITNIETVKSMSIEPQFVKRWDSQIAAYVAAGFRANTLSNLGQQLIQLVGKGVTLGTLFIGAKLVIDGKLTVGGLVAFNMMSQRVAAPVLRLAQLWQDFQQVGISMQRLGDILNSRSEASTHGATLPAVKGEISFEQVRFRYRPDSVPVLDNVTLQIKAGEVVGIVGRSGSGKSTLTKLLLRLHSPESGRVKIDGVDLAMADPIWLRRQIGVVLQENQLFHRSIRSNIALNDPAIPLDAIIQAARLAGAHDFIAELPEGYETIVGEHGCTLSGGQRQRIAIARALVTNPRILIFDEATSALDFETEKTIQENMDTICRGRTVIIIAHRLRMVRRAHRIFAFDRGHVVEQGEHQSLVDRGGYYAHLMSLQDA